MVLINFGLCGFNIKRGCLFGTVEDAPMYAVALFFCEVYFIHRNAEWMFKQAVQGLSRDPEWLAKHRAAIEQATDAQHREELKLARQQIQESTEQQRQLKHENAQLNDQLQVLKRAVQIIEHIH